MKPQFSSAVALDFESIMRYVSQHDRAAARRLMARLERKCELVALNPGLGAVSDIQPGLRAATLDNYVIYYRVIENRVLIVRIIHSARDAESAFRDPYAQ